MQHRLYQLCYRAHLNTSHVPDTRAKSWCESFDEDAAAVKEAGGDLSKHEALFTAWMSAKSRCASSMITGPANFNNRRAEKANNAEMNHGKAYYDYIDRLKSAKKLEEYYAANPHNRPIKSDDGDAVQRLQEKLAAQETEHARLKALPKSEREWYTLPYSLKAIKATRDRLAQLQRTTALPHTEVQKDGYKVIQNPEAMRVQIEFEGKPDYDTRERLKSLGFKWAPRLGVWQRLLNNAGIYAAKSFMQDAK